MGKTSVKTVIARAVQAPDTAKQKEAVIGKTSYATAEQLVYAKILDIGMKIGLAGIIISFALYVSGVIAPKIPVTQVSNYWGMRSHDYLVQTNIQSGWSWLGLYKYGDFLNFFPIAFLAGITILCYAAIIPMLLKKKDTVYAGLALLEVIVLVAAASGLVASGGH